MHYFISAGEASGDLHAAQLIAALKRLGPQARFTFSGGDMMAEAAGTPPAVHYRDMAYMGFTQVILHSRELLRILRLAKDTLRRERPDCLILVDYPSFNLKLAAEAVRLGIPVYYYISPKVWAWKEHRVEALRRYTRRIFSILPFEVEWYRSRHGMDVEYVGNPSVNEVDARISEIRRDDARGKRFRAGHGLDRRRPLLALVPGSRRSEIKRNLPVMIEAARQFGDMQPVIAGAPSVDPGIYRRHTSGIPVVEGATFELVYHSAGALVTSGTATLEAALCGTPQVVCYRANGSRLTYHIFKRILKVPFVSLPNLIAGRAIVAEQLLHRCTPRAVADALREAMTSDTQQAGYTDMRAALGDSDAAATAARTIVAELTRDGSHTDV